MDAAPSPAELSKPSRGWLFWALFLAALAVSVVAVFFFGVGLSDGTVSSFNAGIWTFLLLLSLGVPLAGWQFHARGWRRAAYLVLSVLALPGLVYLLFILLMFTSATSWQ